MNISTFITITPRDQKTMMAINKMFLDIFLKVVFTSLLISINFADVISKRVAMEELRRVVIGEHLKEQSELHEENFTLPHRGQAARTPLHS